MNTNIRCSLLVVLCLGLVGLAGSCRKKEPEPQPPAAAAEFQWQIDQFADLRILRYQVPGFEALTPARKELLYYLGEAALCGRDIIFDQNYKHNLVIRRTLDAVVRGYKGDRNDPRWAEFMTYVKRVWFSNGIHHHYANDKFVPGFDAGYFDGLVKGTEGEAFPLAPGQSLDDLLAFLRPILFDPAVDAKKVSLDSSGDLVRNSAVNFYDGVTQAEVEAYYKGIADPKDPTPVSYGLNSRLVKKDGRVVEEVYSLNGLYGPAIAKIVYWLEKASTVAEDDAQKKVIDALVAYYKSGSLEQFDEYSILWVKDLASLVDFVNGFIEVYNDPLGMKATWESVVNFKDLAATKRTDTISANAQWFEDHSPVDPKYRKKEVKGVSAKVITAAMIGGDCYPSTPIGINLPNANWIRKDYGSKSVTIENFTYAYDQSSLKSPFGPEFTYSPELLERARKYGALAGNIHTDLHEVLGHGSGQLMPGVGSDSLKNYHSAVEESRADLFGLYYIMDDKMLELGLLPDKQAAMAEYDLDVRNGLLTQLVRIQPGKTVEEAHMRSRAMIAHWVYEKGRPENVIERLSKDGKTFFIINDYQKLRALYGRLLAEVQRITSEGDYEAAKALVEGYGVQVDPELHKEVLERYAKLNLAPYAGFVNPVYTPVVEDGKIVDVKIDLTEGYIEQMLRYGRDYSFLR
ncbi:MAG TPA: dihydrofolate reductase [Candidatus Aminicenantes bacterium]|nr:dihydrofolate reductase [Candidatus Aminicenantes bacterium]HRY65882.1 dihydrofolate reductase [Candidatus Aminicenantes bacterium]HRZ72792.1 dihydrofolate reductase [Candidatus Aminicenantes bacterium]